MFPRNLLFLVFGALLCVSTYASSQTPGNFDLEKDRLPYLSLDGQWRFHPGDDPHYADPAFDDSSWTLIRAGRGWDSQGFKGLSGLAWYRAKVRIPAGRTKLALYVYGINDSSQIFLDGQMIGAFGDMPPNPRANFQIRRLYPLPLQPSSQPRVVTLAIRVWHWPHWAAKFDGGIIGPLRIGDATFLRLFMNYGIHDDAWFAVDDIVLIFLWNLTGIAALALFALRRDREYLWFGLYLILIAALDSFNIYARLHAFGSKDADLIRNFFHSATQLVEIAFYFFLLRGKRNWLFWTAIATAVVISPVCDILMFMEYGNYAAWNMVYIALSLPFRLWILTLVIQRTRQGLLDARLLLAPVLLQQLIGITSTTFLIAQYLGWRGKTRWFHVVSEWPFAFSVPDLGDLLFLVAMVSIFLYRFYRNSREQEELKREREAARTVQQILVPEAIAEIPGFEIHSVYKPDSEVGGDFFQIIPLLDGAALIAIGDVSGKGLPAALLVSLLVGTLNTLAETTTSPAQLLCGLNRHVLGRSQGGFTTCLILHAEHDGKLTFANAGHLSPYLDGNELPLENGLPLGITEHLTYIESSLLLQPNQQLTLLTDGILEARNSSTGELFGFDRMSTVAINSAEQIAHVAQAFGQEDDVTVLTLVKLATA